MRWSRCKNVSYQKFIVFAGCDNNCRIFFRPRHKMFIQRASSIYWQSISFLPHVDCARVNCQVISWPRGNCRSKKIAWTVYSNTAFGSDDVKLNSIIDIGSFGSNDGFIALTKSGSLSPSCSWTFSALAARGCCGCPRLHVLGTAEGLYCTNNGTKYCTLKWVYTTTGGIRFPVGCVSDVAPLPSAGSISSASCDE